ncbi:hypothetical protein CPB83DRAFT_900101 [Crepidotus variabilis]|uniref:Uncharacterized protein n=1 Tax=Crepidotus variabilis TaxID=179855 RepID=A0A9P6JIB9_9AGAR|nr:hypothetical protein CPB83DRAFT_900101 [Crepidotus variabilis]
MNIGYFRHLHRSSQCKFEIWHLRLSNATSNGLEKPIINQMRDPQDLCSSSMLSLKAMPAGEETRGQRALSKGSFWALSWSLLVYVSSDVAIYIESNYHSISTSHQPSLSPFRASSTTPHISFDNSLERSFADSFLSFSNATHDQFALDLFSNILPIVYQLSYIFLVESSSSAKAFTYSNANSTPGIVVELRSAYNQPFKSNKSKKQTTFTVASCFRLKFNPGHFDTGLFIPAIASHPAVSPNATCTCAGSRSISTQCLLYADLVPK